MDILVFSQTPAGNFLVSIIAWLIKISSSIALGVVLFTVLLKLITLPFDYFSRASMRKNSLKMEEMRPELEKLQQQYANDKELYQKKLMALYKKNNYSMMGSCLPLILTLVIFIVAIRAFTTFSEYQNREYFYNMSKAYNNVIYSGMELDESESKYITRGADGELVYKGEELYKLYKEGKTDVLAKDKDGNDFKIYFDVQSAGTDSTNDEYVRKMYNLFVHTENSFVKAKLAFDEFDYADDSKDKVEFSKITYEVREEKLSDSVTIEKLGSEENNYLKVQLLNEDGSFKLDANGDVIEKGFSDAGLDAKAFVLDIRQQKSADQYRSEQASFLWVKNIWVTDSPFAHPVMSTWEEFKKTYKYDTTTSYDIGEDGYASLTKKLTVEKNAPNGYFILVVLTAGTSLLMQLIMSKSQKSQMELQTVDGKGVQTQKMMTIIMPIMMAIFAFMYTSAFSIYIVLSSVISMLTTVGINKIVDTKYKKENSKKEEQTHRIRGRIYTPKKEEVKEESKKDKKDKKKPVNQHGDNDFMSGKADGKKHIRGRLK